MQCSARTSTLRSRSAKGVTGALLVFCGKDVKSDDDKPPPLPWTTTGPNAGAGAGAGSLAEPAAGSTIPADCFAVDCSSGGTLFWSFWGSHHAGSLAEKLSTRKSWTPRASPSPRGQHAALRSRPPGGQKQLSPAWHQLQTARAAELYSESSSAIARVLPRVAPGRPRAAVFYCLV